MGALRMQMYILSRYLESSTTFCVVHLTGGLVGGRVEVETHSPSMGVNVCEVEKKSLTLFLFGGQ